jgi:hypothetical protein
MEESRAREIALEYARSSFNNIPFVEYDYGSMVSEDGKHWVSSPHMNFVTLEQADVNCKFRATWIAFFYIDFCLDSTTMHGRMVVYIDAETEDTWENPRYGNRKLTAQEKLVARKERRKARKNKGLIE